MSNQKSGGFIKREFMRFMLQRVQDMDMSMFMTHNDLPEYDDIEEELNIPYMNRDEDPLAMDIFKPIVPAGTELPVVVTIHGGGLYMGDRKLSRSFSRLLAHRGYLVFSLEYRLVPKVNVCQQFDDVCAGLDLVGRRLVDFDVDFTRVFLAAESAGAYLATYVTAMRHSTRLQEAIGYQPGRLVFKALGLMSGMVYTNRDDPCGKVLFQQFYGTKQADENFLQYMDPEHPEIINNLPPVYLITSRGDFVNHYSVLFHDALKRAGKPTHLLYYGDKKLIHSFSTLQLDDPRAVESVDKMLAWFEEQASAAAAESSAKRRASGKKTSQKKRMEDGSMDDQPIWRYVLERAEADPGRASAPAIIDCARTYTYAQMFDMWERYARVFSALGMTGADHTRAGVAGAITAQPLFAFYGLNMTGAEVSMLSYPDFLPGGRWKTMIEKEHLTDLILTDIMVTPQLWAELQREKERLGLRNIILMHSRMGGPCVGPAELVYNEFNERALRRIPGPLFMDDLIEKYADTPIVYGEKGGDDLAVIVHTSGSTKGTRKPLPYTNKKVNAAASSMPLGFRTKLTDRYEKNERARVTATFDFSSYMNLIGQADMSFSAGDSLVLTFFGFMHPKFVRAIGYYKITEILLTSIQLDSWMALADTEDIDFSSLRVVCMGGSYISPAKARAYMDFLRDHGYRYEVTRGYGMSEVGGAQLYIPTESDRDILGYPMPPQDFYVLDDEDGQFHCVTEGERTGTMYVTNASMSLNTLDGEELFRLTEIDGRLFVCTNDAVHVNADTSLTYAGRMDKFFVNNDGVRFESGIIEPLLGSLPSVSQMTIVPILDKRIHDSVPVLFVQTAATEADCAKQIGQRLEEIYTQNERLAGTVLPTQLVFVDSFPTTTSSKIDSGRLASQRILGRTYDILPAYGTDGSLSAVRCELAEEISSLRTGALPQELEGASALGLFEAFNGGEKDGPSLLDGVRMLRRFAARQSADWKEFRAALRSDRPDLKALTPDLRSEEMLRIIDKVTEVANTAQGRMYHQETMDYDFED